MDDVVIDFAVDLENDRVLVVEMNPFNNYIGCGTGILPLFCCCCCSLFSNMNALWADAAMFDWKKDAKVLTEGPFQFRVEKQPVENVKRVLMESFRKLIAEV